MKYISNTFRQFKNLEKLDYKLHNIIQTMAKFI